MKTFLFHLNEPKGRIFTLKDDIKAKLAELEAEGWVDTPAKLDLPPEEKTDVTAEQVQNMAPDEIVGFVRAMGFVVMTPDELEAEKVKAREIALAEASVQHNVPEDIESEGVAQTEVAIAEVFASDPEALTKEQLIEFGNANYDLGLTRSMKEATLIEKIKAAQEV